MVRRLVCFGVCVLAVCASAAVTHRVEEERTNEVDDSWWPNKQITMVQRMLNDCSSGEPFTVCLKAKAVTFLDRVLRKDNIPVMEGLSLVSDGTSARSRSGRALTEEEVVASLPRELAKKEETLDEMIVNKISEFFSTHKVNLDMAEDSTDIGEGRKKDKKLMPYLMFGKLVAAGHLALALKGLALLALKALFISKIALVLAGLVAVKKLFSSGGGHKYEVITSEHHEGGHDRVYAPQEYSQDLAYRGYPAKQQ